MPFPSLPRVRSLVKSGQRLLNAVPPGTASLWVSAGLWLIGGLVMFFVMGHAIVGDAGLRFEALQDLLDHGKLPRTDGRGGLPPAQYSLVGPLLSSPLYLLGRWIQTPSWWCERYNVLLLVGFGALLMWSLHGRVKATTAAAIVLATAFCSMFPHHIIWFYGEVFSATMICGGLAVAILRNRSWGWVLVILGCVNTMAWTPGVALAVVLHSVKRRTLRTLLVPAIAALCILIDARLRHDAWFDFGYSLNGFTKSLLPYARQWGFDAPFLVGLASILLSFGKGLIFFAPAFFVPLPKATDPALVHYQRLLQAVLVGMLLVYSKFTAWSGDWYWGPRYFLLAAVPSSLALALWLKQPSAALWSRWAALLGFTLSGWVALDGVTYALYDVGICQADQFREVHLCWYVPDYSPLWRPFLIPSRQPLVLYWQIASFVVVVYAWISFSTWRTALHDTWRLARDKLGGLFALKDWRL